MYLEKSIQRKTRHQITEKSAHEFSCKNVISAMTEIKKPNARRNAMRKRAGGMAKAMRGQARKGAGWMPWHRGPTKDAISCDKPRGGANALRSADF